MDGAFVVYSALQGDSTVLWYRNLRDASTGPINGTAGASMARISPDGAQVAFVAPGQIMVIPIAGGVPRRLSNAGVPVFLEWVSPTRLLLVHSDGYRVSWLDPEVGETEAERTIPRCLFGEWMAEATASLWFQRDRAGGRPGNWGPGDDSQQTPRWIARYLRVIPNWVTKMKAAVDSANR